MIPVIICGGVGSKMWPVSRSCNPKHFARLLGNKSLFQLNYEALRLKFEPDEILVQTNALQARLAQEQAPEIPLHNYLIEPETRNHGPAMGLMAARLFKTRPDEPYMIVQADVLRRPADKFLAMIEQMDALIRRDGKLMSGGFHPSSGVMGVDYMVLGDKVEGTGAVTIHRMKQWVGRDNKESTEKTIRNEDVFLHANHYAWTPRAMLEAYKRWAPEWYEPLARMIGAMGTADEARVIAEEYAKMPIGPVEARVTRYELNDAYVVELPFEWIDFGTWESLVDYVTVTGVHQPGEQLIEVEGSGNFAWVDGKRVAVIGLSDLVIVDSRDALLIMRKSDSGKVGQVVDRLKEKGETNLL